MKTFVVNLHGGPGAGKSTTSTGVFSLAKIHDVNTEYVNEYAKDRAWEGTLMQASYNPFYILTKQYQKQMRLNGKVAFMITDSPLLQASVYSNDKFFKEYAKNLFDRFENINYFIRRKKVFNPKGRGHNLKQAKQLDRKIKNVLKKHNYKFKELDGNFDAINTIITDVLTRLNIEPRWKVVEEEDREYFLL